MYQTVKNIFSKRVIPYSIYNKFVIHDIYDFDILK